MEHFEKHSCAVIKTADKLLNRYRKTRRKPGVSPAGRILLPCLAILPGIEAFLPPENLHKFRQLATALEQRYRLLQRRRIPPCPELRRLRQRCQALMRALPAVPRQWDAPSVLVGTLRTLDQLDICLEYGFYHVPARLIPLDRLPIDYVAIYQSRLKFSDDCGVRIFGRVKNCIPVQRWQIMEIPKQSDELYYRLEVECWKQLEPNIDVLEIPFTVLFTNLFLLLHSKETPELELKSPSHYLLYQALKKSISLGDGTVFRHPGGTVRHSKGLFQIYRHGRRIAAFVTEDFEQTPSDIFNQLMNILDKK